MEPKLQRRIQRYGWDLAADAYPTHWRAQLDRLQHEAMALAAVAPGERVLDVACGNGATSIALAHAVGPGGRVLGVDLSGRMIEAATRCAADAGLARRASFARMDAEHLALPDDGFDAALCTLGLMYVPEPDLALRELHRVLRPGGRAVLAVWGDRARCGWAPAFEIVDAEVSSEVCPLFFGLGRADALAAACGRAGLCVDVERRLPETLHYAVVDDACDAAFVGGPVALAWSRFDAATRDRVRAAYARAIEPWRTANGYAVPAEFVLVLARRPEAGDHSVATDTPCARIVS